jgi:hypothetical protein
MRFASVMFIVSLVGCVSPAQQARQQAAAPAMHAEEPIAGNLQAEKAWWPVRFADENKCIIQGYQRGTDAFAQCVSTTVARQREPHRCTYCRSLD